MHLEKQSYDKAVDEIKNVFNLLRIQLQKIQEDAKGPNATFETIKKYNEVKQQLLSTSVKKEIFTDLFGYPDGPKYQTNEEKILAYGFDLKTSFRKM